MLLCVDVQSKVQSLAAAQSAHPDDAQDAGGNAPTTMCDHGTTSLFAAFNTGERR